MFGNLRNVMSGGHLTPEEVREARLRRAQHFIYTVLLPFIEAQGTVLLGDVERLLRDFTKSKNVPGSDFEWSHVWGHLYKKMLELQCIADEAPHKLPENTLIIATAFELVSDIMGEEAVDVVTEAGDDGSANRSVELEASATGGSMAMRTLPKVTDKSVVSGRAAKNRMKDNSKRKVKKGPDFNVVK